MTKHELMTESEIHDFGVETVFGYLKKEGYTIEAVNTDLSKNPQIVAKKDDDLCFISVRTACYPKKGEIATEAEFFSILDGAQKHKAIPYFAAVGLCYADAKDEKEAGMPFKGAGFHISFDGLLIMTTSDKVKIMNS
jgi:hypothetical protein